MKHIVSRQWIWCIVCGMLLAGTGCGSSKPQPILRGIAVSGTAWEKPLISPNNAGNGIKGNLVEVFGNVVIITNLESKRSQISSIDHISDLIVEPQ